MTEIIAGSPLTTPDPSLAAFVTTPPQRCWWKVVTKRGLGWRGGRLHSIKN